MPNDRDVIDVKFKPVKPKTRIVWSFDWRLFLIIAACSAIAALASLLR